MTREMQRACYESGYAAPEFCLAVPGLRLSVQVYLKLSDIGLFAGRSWHRSEGEGERTVDGSER